MFLDDEYIMQSFNPFASMKRSKTDNQYMLKNEINTMNSNNFHLNVGFQNQINNGSSSAHNGWVSKFEDDAAIKMKDNT